MGEFFEVRRINNLYFDITLPSHLQPLFVFNERIMEFNVRTRRMEPRMGTTPIYHSKKDNTYRFGIGMAEYVLEVLLKSLPTSRRMFEGLYELISLEIERDSHPINFSNLYPNQNLDLQSLLRYKRGIFQTFTGYGKTEVICTLAQHALISSEGNVLIITNGNKALDELSARWCKSIGYDSVPYFDYSSRLNIINVNGFLKSKQFDPSDVYFSNVSWIIADEVENCLSDTAYSLYECCVNCDRFYGFSATADKKKAKNIQASSRSDEEKVLQMHREHIGANRYLINMFSMARVYRRPDDFNIRLTTVQSNISTRNIGVEFQSLQYNQYMADLFRSDPFRRLVEGIATSGRMTYVPMPRLKVIDDWMSKSFKKEGTTVVVICSRGYELYSSGRFIRFIDLMMLKSLVKNGCIDVILGTKSSYSALDLPELDRILLLNSSSSGIVIQAIGRVARNREFEVINISTVGKLSGYTADLNNRVKLIKSYYSDCNIVEITEPAHKYACGV